MITLFEIVCQPLLPWRGTRLHLGRAALRVRTRCVQSTRKIISHPTSHVNDITTS